MENSARPRHTAPGNEWERYLTGYHNERPGITERLLGAAVDKHGFQPYSWLADPLRDTAGPVLDLACGSAPTRTHLAGKRWLGVDLSARELAVAAGLGRGPLLQASGDRLPIRTESISAVCAAMCLQMLTPLDDVLAELHRVLRPGGRLAALVPAGMRPGRAAFRWWRIMRTLGIRSLPWPNPQANDGLPALLQAHGFTVDSSDRRDFLRAISSPDDAQLLIDGLYLPDTAPDRISTAKNTLASWSGPGLSMVFPLHRVIAHRPARGGR
ncbi:MULTISPECIES: class I SAM-dependent methyltransferase [unclassified Nocardia]|uniref:class I SAM-dependent methyltransferase n=1 Tax=unclassified Nocardia TaxID=2637762 RepID=UPI00278C309A|nr:MULTISPECIES: class I SAM-dependent methyltransferase [unclassified Nocardia]